MREEIEFWRQKLARIEELKILCNEPNTGRVRTAYEISIDNYRDRELKRYGSGGARWAMRFFERTTKMTVSENQITKFKEAIKKVCKDHGLGFYLTDDYCGAHYDCSGGQMNIVELLENADDITMYPFFDLRKQNEEDAQAQRDQEERDSKRNEERSVNARLFVPLVELFEKHGLVLYADMFKHVRAIPFARDKWTTLTYAEMIANPLRSSTLAERAITKRHRDQLPEFWSDLEKLCMEVGLMPEAYRVGDPESRAPLFVSPRYDDPLPYWIINIPDVGRLTR